LHFSETNFEPFASNSKDCIKQNEIFGPRVPNLPYTERALSCYIIISLMLTNLACPISRAWDYNTALRSHHRQTWSHGT